jgi:hypothetical protein
MNTHWLMGRGPLRADATRRPGRSLGRWFGVAGALALASVTAACSAGSAAGGEASVEITSPATGSEVGRSFEVVFDAGVPLGEPDTGRNHIHLYLDGGSEYEIVYDETHSVTGLDPGEHSLVAVVANADHSETDARSSAVVVEVTDADTGAEGADGTAPPATSDVDLGY